MYQIVLILAIFLKVINWGLFVAALGLLLIFFRVIQIYVGANDRLNDTSHVVCVQIRDFLELALDELGFDLLTVFGQLPE